MIAFISYLELYHHFRKSLRNGKWKKLSMLEKAQYIATLSCARIKGRIVSPKILSIALSIIEKLRSNPFLEILRKGVMKEREMLEACERRGVFSWCPALRDWLRDPYYALWLGLNDHPNYPF
ncbi:MAG: hypothetical protein APU95_02385 [Hadesarchaea archaeon YNP_N21]|nr:MAG: hypothetical protein APU95_02325 [Hadesarchaea archaeon YNP_N21]KUO42825.1 MAG: hypothetical protein APU95_02385 [Hadesarchaea archaeon YNP_N21]